MRRSGKKPRRAKKEKSPADAANERRGKEESSRKEAASFTSSGGGDNKVAHARSGVQFKTALSTVTRRGAGRCKVRASESRGGRDAEEARRLLTRSPALPRMRSQSFRPGCGRSNT